MQLNCAFSTFFGTWSDLPVRNRPPNQPVQTPDSEPTISTRLCFAYQFHLPSMKTYYDVTRERLYIYANP